MLWICLCVYGQFLTLKRDYLGSSPVRTACLTLYSGLLISVFVDLRTAK